MSGKLPDEFDKQSFTANDDMRTNKRKSAKKVFTSDFGFMIFGFWVKY